MGTFSGTHRAGRRVLAAAGIAVASALLLTGCGEKTWAGTVDANMNSGIYLGESTGGYNPDQILLKCTQKGDEMTAVFSGPGGTFTTKRPEGSTGRAMPAGGVYTDTNGNDFTWTLQDKARVGQDQSEDGTKTVFTKDTQWGTPVSWGADGVSIKVVSLNLRTPDDRKIKVRIKDASCADPSGAQALSR